MQLNGNPCRGVNSGLDYFSYPPVVLVSRRHTYPELRLLYRGSSDCRDIAVSSGVGATVIVHDIAVIINLNPAPTAADVRIYVGAHISRMCVFLSRCGLPGQIEVELSGLARLRRGVSDRCFDLSIDKQSGFISGNSRAIADIMAVRVSVNNLGKILRFNRHIGVFNWAAGRVFHNPSNTRRARPNSEGSKQ